MTRNHPALSAVVLMPARALRSATTAPAVVKAALAQAVDDMTRAEVDLGARADWTTLRTQVTSEPDPAYPNTPRAVATVRLKP